MKMVIRTIAIGCVLLAGIWVVDGLFGDGIFIKETQAKIGIPGKPGIGKPGRPGKPGIPLGVAVVAHRTTRRDIRRTAVYVETLPEGCQSVVIEGTTLHQCGETYYQASGDQYVVVEVD